MPRRKKKGKKNTAQGQKRFPEEALFNPALEKLAPLRKGAHQGPETLEGTALKIKKKEKAVLLDEDRLFIEAMDGVEPINRNNRIIIKTPDEEALRPPHSPRNGDLEVMAHLSDLISGTTEMDITFSDEYMEGCVKGVDPRLMRQLKDGLFPIQDYVDLHRLTQEAAEVRIRDFLIGSHGRGLRCVLIVHGKGLNSENHTPVLKRRLPTWLSRGPVRKIILAFSTAKPYDGGTGAIYVLLKRSKGGL